VRHGETAAAQIAKDNQQPEVFWLQHGIQSQKNCWSTFKRSTEKHSFSDLLPPNKRIPLRTGTP